jgi:CHASE3 domain sensor protein
MYSVPFADIVERSRAVGAKLLRLSLNAKLRIMGLGAGVLVCSAIIVVAQGYRDVVESGRMTEHSYQVLLTIATVESRMIDLETGQRGYLLTGEDDYLEPYLYANIVLDKTFDSLVGSTVDNANQQRSAAELRKLIGARRALIDRSIFLRRAQRATAALKIVASGEGKRLDNLIRAELVVMEREERRLLNQRREVEQMHIEAYRWISIYGAILIIFCLTAILLLIRDDLIMRAKLKSALRNLDEDKTIALTVVQRFIRDRNTVRIASTKPRRETL